MCEYCKNIGTDEPCKPIIEHQEPFHIFGNLYLDALLQTNKKLTQAELAIDFGSDNDSMLFATKIKYCPICGANLSDILREIRKKDKLCQN